MKIDVQEFEARVKTGAIRKFEHPTEPDIVGWCYTQKCQYDKMWDEHTILARGIVTTRDGDVVSRPFPKFFNLGEKEAEPIDWKEPVEITEKVDGCMSPNVHILTSEGYIKIGKIVNNKLQVLVATFNENLKTIEYKPISNYHKFENDKLWIRIVAKSRKHGSAIRSIVCTNDHQFYTESGYIQAKDLKIKENIFLYGDTLNYLQKQIILGTLLGDGSIVSKSTIGFSHCEKQKEYVDLKCKALYPLTCRLDIRHGGYPGSGKMIRSITRTNPSVRSLLTEYCISDSGKKYVGKKWVDALDPLAISIWYMDDGSCSFSKPQRPRAHFATNGFPIESVKLLSECLRKRFGIDNGIFDYKGPTIVVTADGTERLFGIISPYITNSMKYKMPKKYHNVPCIIENMISNKPNIGIYETEIIKIETENIKIWENGRKSNYSYDITVKDNHNYFAGDMLVHNSLIVATSHENKMIINSKGSFKSEHANFAHLWIKENVPAWKPTAGYTYLFEAVFPSTNENEVKVVNYGDRADLTLLSVINTKTGEEYPYHQLKEFGKEIGIPVVVKYDSDAYVTTIDKVKSRASVQDGEGIVIHFLNSNKRIKVKSDVYIRLHRLISHANKKTILEMIMNGDNIEEIYAPLPDEFYRDVKKWVEEFNTEHSRLIEIVNKHLPAVKALPTRSAQAKYVYSTPELDNIRGLVFLALDDRDISYPVWELIKKNK